MLRFQRPGRAISKLAASLLLLAISCGGGSCGGGAGPSCGAACAPSTYRFPVGDPRRPDAIVQDDAVRARINQRFIDFIKPRIPDLIRSRLVAQSGVSLDGDGVIHVPLPDTQLADIGVASANLRQAEALIWIDDIEQHTDVRFEAPSSLRITLEGLRLGVNAKLREDFAGTTSSCPIEGQLGPLGPGPLNHAAELTIDMSINPGVGADPERDLQIEVSVDDLRISDLAVHVRNDYCSEPECQDCAAYVLNTCLDVGGRCAECHVFCGGITDGVLRLSSALVDLVRPILNRVMAPIAETILGNTLNNLNGSTAKVEQPLALADIIPIGSMRAANPVGIFAAPKPGRFPVVDRGTGLGMEITTSFGAEGPLSDCVVDPGDFVPMTGPVPDLAGRDPAGRPYHVGVTIASSLINQVLFAAERSGSLCLRITTGEVRDLTGGRFTLNASLLSLLAADLAKLADDKAPVILELKPRSAPTVSLGSGERIGMDAMGNPISDWLLKVNVQDMGIAFHVFIQDRYVRVFEVTTDIRVGLNVNILPDNRLELAVGELKVDDFEERFNEILPNANFAMVLPTLIEIAMQALVQDSLSFPVDIRSIVSDALGGAPIYLRLSPLFRDGAQQDFLTLALTFTSTPSDGAHLLSAETFAELEADDGLLAREDRHSRPTGQLRLRVGTTLPPDLAARLEYQVRVDRGLWRRALAPREDGTIFVEDAHLMLPGAHTVEVRARDAGDYQTLDPTPVMLVAHVDPFPPRVSAVFDGREVSVRVVDRETPPDEPLTLEARVDGGEPIRVPLSRLSGEDADTAVGRILVSTLGGGRQLELEASDPRGNRSEVVRMPLVANVGLDGDGPSSEGCACSDAGPRRNSGLAAFGVSAILALALFSARRRRRAPS